MEEHNLQTASTYINNLLLARGLLKNGTPIDFANPGNGSAGTRTTMARIINLINDLILRRDREAEHRENLAASIQTLRATESQQTLEIEKLRTKSSELTRSLALAEGQERAFKANLSSAESTTRVLKDQLQRMKSTIQQIRAQCANDIRKRDIDMQKLKSHLADRQRGRRDGLGVTTINIHPTLDQTTKPTPPSPKVDINDPGYTLRQETTEFLTELCQNLSDENDTLINLARKTIQTLKDLQGIPTSEGSSGDTTDISMGTCRGSHGPVETLPASCDELSAEMDLVLDHLRTLLTNPSFVPLEEVEIRDEEIMRLREGWERMEGRWKEAVAMMEGWHKRISDGGDSVHTEELKTGMGLGLGVDKMRKGHSSIIGEQTPESSVYEDEAEEASTSDGESQLSEPGGSTAKRKRPRTSNYVLEERSMNISSNPSRKVSFHGDSVEPTSNDAGKGEIVLVEAHSSDAVTQRPVRRKVQSKIPHQPSKRPRLLIKEKLAAVEAEAQAVQKRKKQPEDDKHNRSTTEPGRKKRQGRRRSTLSHTELDQLLGMSSNRCSN
ncbi:hypothetical protein Egran_01921 [Elaphomyces granulatus]|uniref:NIMA interactive protein n=1 Tax=Elaphomyces granulatus TaxID=519963 RepID=A0A232M1V5_9EURO|nr:hypothetical protein Egran_01921 [Elaphomyces granulatus]